MSRAVPPVLARLLGAARGFAGTPQAWSLALALGVLTYGTARMLGPMTARWDTYGFHDWDSATAYRYITTLSLLEYGELPWWHPWFCGGLPAFGYSEGASNLVSPYLPVHLLFDVRTALRLEVLGSTVTALVGMYLFAARFTRSVALATFAAALFALNGRWALQLATGHTWHLQFCWLPWILWCFDRSLEEGRFRAVVPAGVLLALLVYLGAIYPAPYTALTLTLYAVGMAAVTRRWRPLGALAVAAGIGLGLAAPKLAAVADGMSQVPRLIESTEVIGVRELVVMLTDPTQRYGEFPVRVPAYNWHEWGIYIGPLPLAALALGALFARGPRALVVRSLGLGCLLLGFGAFHEHSPWALLHRLPVFSSLHVPSRFLFVMVGLLAVAFVAWAAPRVDAWLWRWPWLDALLLLPVLFVVHDVTTVSRRAVAQAFWMEAPHPIARAERFEHRSEPVVHYVRRDWAPPVLLPMFANTGVIRCYGVPPSLVVGAVPADAPGYRGMAYVVGGAGEAQVERWSPNRVVVQVTGAAPGTSLVYAMNFDSSWRANGQAAKVHDHQVATPLAAGDSTIVFRYYPRTLPYTLPIALLTLGLVVWLMGSNRGPKDRWFVNGGG